MVKKSMDDLLKRRMSAAQQASELEVGNEAYETMFQAKADVAAPRFCELPIKSLCPFRTADIGFRPYPPEKLRAFSQQLAEQGIYERIIVRPVPNSEQYEILAGHNRTEAWRLTGQSTIPAEVVEADDARAISIAVATNLLRRQDLTIIERGKAYRALLIESNRNGQRNVAYPTFGENRQRLKESSGNSTSGDSRQKLDGDSDGETFGENRQRYNARKIVADFFGVTEYEIRKAIKLAALIPPLADILENSPRKLPIACAELIADYWRTGATAAAASGPQYQRKETTMKNNYSIAQRNAIVEDHLWCIDSIIQKNRPLMRAARLEYDDVYQQLAIRLIKAVAGYDPDKGNLQQHIFAQLKYELLNCKAAFRLCGMTGAPRGFQKSDIISLDIVSENSELHEQLLAA